MEKRKDSFRWFHRPFCETGQGLILGLATPAENIRDALPILALTREYWLLGLDGIVVEPSRPAAKPQNNIILVGSSPLFVKPDAHPISGSRLPLAVGEAKLGERLRRVAEECSLEFSNKTDRSVVNRLTGRTYTPHTLPTGVQIDFGVIRRLYRGGTECTLFFEGGHRLGTYGATLVGVDPTALAAIREIVGKLDGFDESAPLEILVQAKFLPQGPEDVLAWDTVDAKPIALVYNSRFVCDLESGDGWKDLLPWDLTVCLRADGGRRVTKGPATIDAPVPSLVMELDLREHSEAARAAGRKLVKALEQKAGSGAAASDELVPAIEELARVGDQFPLILVHKPAWVQQVKSIDLPDVHRPVQRVRKQFLVLLALLRLADRALPSDKTTIRRLFPAFKKGTGSKSFEEEFKAKVRGKVPSEFWQLLGRGKAKKQFVDIELDRKDGTYSLRLNRAALLIKIRR